MGFSAYQRRLSTILENMADFRTGVRARSRATRGLFTGTHYFVPSNREPPQWIEIAPNVAALPRIGLLPLQ
jgi:hypothetical protein